MTRIDLTGVMAGFKSALMKDGGDIPEGHYTDESMSATVVPGRNIIFLSILAGAAWSAGATMIAIGVHKGDHAIYPDCREQFIAAMSTAIFSGTDGRVCVSAPFRDMDKISILKWGLEHDVPYTLTRTCYKDQVVSCGKCGSCVERLEAFELNEIEDPIPYYSRGVHDGN